MSDTDIGFDLEGNSLSYFALAISRLIYCQKICGDFEVLGITTILDCLTFLLGYSLPSPGISTKTRYIPGDGKQISVQFCSETFY